MFEAVREAYQAAFAQQAQAEESGSEARSSLEAIASEVAGVRDAHELVRRDEGEWRQKMGQHADKEMEGTADYKELVREFEREEDRADMKRLIERQKER